MKLFKTKKTILAIGVILALVITGTFSTLAYLTDIRTADNNISIGAVKIELTEPNFNPESPIAPGEFLAKNPIVTNKYTNPEDGETLPAYVRLKVTIPKATIGNVADMPIFTLYNGETAGINTNKWTEGDTVNGAIYYYYLGDNGTDGILAPTKETEPLFTKVQLNPDITEKDTTEVATIIVVAEAIQTKPFATEAEAWAAYDTENP